MIAKLPLRFKLTIPFVIIMLTLALGISSLAYWSAKSNIDQLSNDWLQEKSLNITQAIEAHFVGVDLSLSIATPRSELLDDRIANRLDQFHQRFWRSALQGKTYKTIHFVNSIGNSYSFQCINSEMSKAWLRDDGNVSEYNLKRANQGGIEGQASIAPENVHLQSYLLLQNKQYENNRAYVDTYRDQNLGFLKAIYSKPILDQGGNRQGAIGIEIPLTNLNLIFDNTELLNKSTTAVLFDAESGKVIFSSDLNDDLSTQQSNGHDKPSMLQSLFDHTVVSSDHSNGVYPALDVINTGTFNNLDFITRSIRIGDSRDWVLVVSQPANYFSHPLFNSLVRNILIGLFGTILCGLLSYLIASSASRDIRYLAKAAKKVGKGDFDTSVDIYRDDEVGQLAAQFRQMEIDLRSDKLTGLYSRDAFEKNVNRRIEAFQTKDEYLGFTILFLDINSFKHINDTMGHQVGDDIIKLVAKKLTKLCSENDLIARYAGDEFVILIEHTHDKHRLPKIINGIESIQSEARIDEDFDTKILDRIDFRLAVGASHFPEDGHTAAILIEVADKNMYNDKRRIKREDLPKF